jgi:hypothetical protein
MQSELTSGVYCSVTFTERDCHVIGLLKHTRARHRQQNFMVLYILLGMQLATSGSRDSECLFVLPVTLLKNVLGYMLITVHACMKCRDILQ